VIILSRNGHQRVASGNLSYAQWNIEKQTIDKEAITDTGHIIHLAGAGVADKRWTKKRKQEIIDSRVESGELIVKALNEIPNNVKSVVSASAIGWYGADPSIPNPRPFTEEDPAAAGFLGETCKKWEASLEPLTKMGKRLVRFRTGIVLIAGGGALEEFEKPLRFGVAAVLGSGRQMISWIHIDDLVNLYIAAIENENMNGTYNAVAPHPVSNKELTLTLAKIKKGKFFVAVYVPSFMLKIALGEMSIEVLKSATVSSAKLHYLGYNYLYSSVETALSQILEPGQ
jgi:uncharacterized protein (TIGR01777 family)